VWNFIYMQTINIIRVYIQTSRGGRCKGQNTGLNAAAPVAQSYNHSANASQFYHYHNVTRLHDKPVFNFTLSSKMYHKKKINKRK
jgi:hypothetical protein